MNNDDDAFDLLTGGNVDSMQPTKQQSNNTENDRETQIGGLDSFMSANRNLIRDSEELPPEEEVRKTSTGITFSFSIEGRSTILDFWVGSIVIVLAGLFACAIFDRHIDSIEELVSEMTSGMPYIGMFFAGLLFALFVRRLHDLGRTGWWMVVPWIPHYIGVLFTNRTRFNIYDIDSYDFFEIVSVLCSCVLILVLGFFPGNNKPNKYGPNPLEKKRSTIEEYREHGNDQ